MKLPKKSDNSDKNRIIKKYQFRERILCACKDVLKYIYTFVVSCFALESSNDIATYTCHG